MNVKFLDVAGINWRYRDEIINCLASTIQQGQFVLGPGVEKFERDFSAYTGVNYAIGVGNGLDALTILLRCAGIGEGDEVIVASNTYIATWLAVSNVNASPVPVEPDETFNLDHKKIEDNITKKTKAILVTHLYGRLANMSELSKISRKHGLFLFEDAAQAHGARDQYGQAGSLSDGAAYSFYPGKNLGAIGDGGAITTNNVIFYESALAIRNYGSKVKYYNLTKGMNSRLDELQARILSLKLKDLDADNAHRKRLALIYFDHLAHIREIALPPPSVAGEHVWHLFTILSECRVELQKFLGDCGVETLIHYPVPPHLQNAYKEHSKLQLPISERVHQNTLSLPISPILSVEKVKYVCKCIESFFQK